VSSQERLFTLILPYCVFTERTHKKKELVYPRTAMVLYLMPVYLGNAYGIYRQRRRVAALRCTYRIVYASMHSRVEVRQQASQDRRLGLHSNTSNSGFEASMRIRLLVVVDRRLLEFLTRPWTHRRRYFVRLSAPIASPPGVGVLLRFAVGRQCTWEGVHSHDSFGCYVYLATCHALKHKRFYQHSGAQMNHILS